MLGVLPYQRYSTKSKAFETTDGGAAVVSSGSSKSAMFDEVFLWWHKILRQLMPLSNAMQCA